MTAGSALQLLVDEGLIYSVPNRGYFVSAPVAGGQVKDSEQSAEYQAIIRHLETLESTVRRLAERVAHLEDVTNAQH